MSERLCLLSIHAHPDDEASKGACTVAKYNAEGVHTVLVCATGGEAGDILNPAMDRPEVRENLTEVRRRELANAAEIIGYREVIELGYRDSGMPGMPENDDPSCFARADLSEAVDRFVAILRRTRPQVVLTYADDQQGYQHPDHLRVHDITGPAVDAAADPDHRPDLGEPWQVAKIYYSLWSRQRMLATHGAFEQLGLESPFGEGWFERPSLDERITTRIEIGEFADVRAKALLAHETQVDPKSPFWFGLPPEVARTVHPFDDYILATSTVPVEEGEDDLFAGLR